ncbi:MAG: polysaccharide deacetylase family protein [Actinomycetota bacterium]|nr:polysaccharide deacetylase family protein [Actinomycetota bacterium]
MTARTLVRRAAGAIDRVFAPPAGLVVLIYHRVGGGTDSAVDMSTADFREQMTLLAQLGTVLSLDDATSALQRDERPVGVVITFDDGAADFCDVAVPVMVDLGLPSTLYLVTAAPDAGSLPWGPPATSWQALRDAAATGLVSVQSHTHDHRLLHRTTAADAAEQLDRSIDAIAHHVGRPPRHFAYPKAVAGNRAARAAVSSRFTSGALAGHRVNTSASHLQRLGRVPVSRTDDLATFRRKVNGGLRAEGLARDVYGRIRYRKAIT